MTLQPPQPAPVSRPHFTQPHTTVDLEHGAVWEVVYTYNHLTYGANHNDPSPWCVQPHDSRMVSR